MATKWVAVVARSSDPPGHVEQAGHTVREQPTVKYTPIDMYISSMYWVKAKK